MLGKRGGVVRMRRFERMITGFWTWSGRHALGCASALLGVCVAVTAVLGSRLALSDVSNIGTLTEGPVFFGIQRLLLGEALYTPTGAMPYVILQYSPLYYLICGGVCRMAGITGEDILGVARVARLVTLCLNPCVWWLLYRLARRSDCTRRMAWLAAGMAMVILFPWNAGARSDLLLTLFMLLGIHAMMRVLGGNARARNGFGWLLVANLCAMLGILSKQNGIVFPAAMLAYFVLAGDWKRAAVTVLAQGAFAVALVVMGPRVFGSGLWDNVIGGINNGVVLLEWVKSITGAALDGGMGVALALGASLAAQAFMARGAPRERFLGVAKLSVLGFAVVTSLKEGAGRHYYHDAALLGLAFAAPWVSRRVEGQQGKGGRVRIGTVAVAAYVVLTACSLTMRNGVEHAVGGHRFGNIRQIVDYLKPLVEEEPKGKLFTTNTTLANFYPRQAVAIDIYVNRKAHDTGEVDYGPFWDDVRAGRIRLLVLFTWETPQQTLGWLGINEARNEEFEKLAEVGHYGVWTWAGKGKGGLSGNPGAGL